MAHEKSTNSTAFLQEALLNDKEFLKVIVQRFLQAFMEKEIAEFLQADPYERCDERTGYRNGYKPRTLYTRVGDIALAVPQGREGSFSTKLFERYQRSEKALALSIIEMYIQGVSTRKVAKIAEELCGHTVSKSQVLRLAQELDQELLAWRVRPLGKYPYLVIDARYEKVRTPRGVVSQSILIVAGVNTEGYREILAVEVANAESATSWGELFRSLIERGLTGVEFVVSDDHTGLVTAVERYFAGAIWQRCQCHFMRNILDKVAKADRAALKADMQAIFNSANGERARELLTACTLRYQSRYESVSEMLEDSADSILACFSLPEGHRRRMRTTNLLERYNQEIKRRTKVVRIFPNEEAALRLITALAAEQSEEWLSGRKYLDMSVRDVAAVQAVKPEPALVSV
ncbi:MAG TPA: IS256 family transposase [Candidatus Aquicultor sp.]|jgi:transposase-like protein